MLEVGCHALNRPCGDSYIDDKKIPTFYATEEDKAKVACVVCMPVFGIVFGGIHCVGWFFDFPSSAEAMLWRVSSVVLTGIAFLFLILFTFVAALFGDSITRTHQRRYFSIAVFSITLLVYVVSRLLLLVEAFISLRHLTSGMLALVKWTSFIPHIWSLPLLNESFCLYIEYHVTDFTIMILARSNLQCAF